MNLIRKIFGNISNAEESPRYKFGRFSDSYKEDEKYDAWDKALDKFEESKYLESFRLFLEYLSDESQENVSIIENGSELRFEIFQGSKKIIGKANNNKVKAEAKIAKTQDLKIGFLRRLVELNFGLKYSRYALDENDNITMLFDTYMLDGSPYKMYYALKELAINADKQDDILLAEFDVLEPINTGHIQEVNENIKEIKYKFLINCLDETKNTLETTKLNIQQYPGGISYLLLNCIYKLDYLVKPEGYTMDAFEKIHKLFFRNDSKSAHIKNRQIIKEMEKIRERQESQFKDEMYQIKSTFGITAPITHDRLSSFIEGEIKNMDWYVENDHDRIALSIPGYIVGYSLFNYALPAPDKDFLHLYNMIINQQFFIDLGFDLNYFKDGILNKSSILKKIDSIVKKHKHEYFNLKPNKKKLKFQSTLKFAKSYLNMVKDLDLKRNK